MDALKSHDWESIDINHLIEQLEIGDPRESVESNLVILIAHLLKLLVQSDAPDWMTGSWYSSINEHRKRIAIAR